MAINFELIGRPSKIQTTAATSVSTAPVVVYGVVVTAGADAASVKVFNATGTGGTPSLVVKAALETTASAMFPNGIILDTALAVDTTGTSPTVLVAWTPA